MILTTLLPGFAGTTLPPWLAARLRAGLGGVCLFAGNITSLAQLRALTDAIYAANPRAVVAVDEEGGDVTRLFARVGSPYPGNAVLGRIDDLDVTRSVAAQVGWQLRRVGCNVTFAPTVDINSNADNPVIGVRSFGAAAEQVAAHSGAWVTGLQSTGVAATAKHFPGHGDTAQDSHVALPVIDRSLDELRQRELLPFVAAIEAGTRMIMTSHIMLPQLDAENPATMSQVCLDRIAARGPGLRRCSRQRRAGHGWSGQPRRDAGDRDPRPAGGLRPAVPGDRQHRAGRGGARGGDRRCHRGRSP